MSKNYIHSQITKIDNLFKKYNDIDVNDHKLKEHWARYLCIIVSGLLENAVRIHYSDFAKDKSHPYISNFTSKNLEGFQNPKAEKIMQIAGYFSDDWRTELEIFLKENDRKSAIDSIVNVRHSLAHGRDHGITFANIKDYYQKAKEVINFIEKQCQALES